MFPFQPNQPSRYLRVCLFSSLGLITPAFATAALTSAATVTPDPLPSTVLDEIVVTATRTPSKITNTIAQTQVIDSDALKRYRGQSALDVLKRQPGVSHYTNGGMGTTSNFYLRGYDKKQILVLIDGVRYSSLSAGGAALQLLPAEQIDRIEILYGASGTSIYGADAMGGVIQIFTKGEDIDRSHLSVTTGIGSHNQYLYGAQAQLTNGSGATLSLAANHNETDGINAKLPGSYGFNKDDDGFESDNYSLLLTQRLNDAIQVGASGLYSESKTQFDDGASQGDDNTHANQKNGAAQAFINWQFTPENSAKLAYGHSIDKADTVSSSDSTFETSQQQVSLIAHQQLPHGQATFGFEHLTQSLDSSTYEADDRKVFSSFLGYSLGSDSIDAQANIRYDDYSKYDSEITYNLGGAYHISPSFRIGANYAKGFRAPTFNDLYYPESGNTDLVPESSDNYEAFVEFDTPLQSTRVTGYRNEVKDLLTYVSKYDAKGKWIGGTTKNVDTATIKGVMLTSDWFINNYLMGLSFDYQNAKNTSGGAVDGHFLPIRPQHKGSVYIGYQWPSFDIRAEYQYVGDYYSNVNNSDSNFVDDYGLFNISGSYQLTPSLSMTARLNNITNEDYVTIPGYNTDGTNFFTSLTYSFP